MLRRLLSLIMTAALCAPAAGLVVTVNHGHRVVHPGWSPPPSDIQEGSVLTTFTGDAAMDTVGTLPGLVRVDAQTWQYRFEWDESAERTFTFRDGGGEQATVVTRPTWPPYDPADHQVPVIMIDTPADSLWDPAVGLYCWGDGDDPNWDQRGEAWERDAVFRWFDADGSLRHLRTIGLRINGNWTRNLPQKSLRLYFDHHAEPEEITDDFFGEGTEDHRRLILRQGSQWPFQFVHDVLAAEIMGALGHPRNRWRPVATYLNGEPWGLYHLRERPDRHWAEEQLGLSGAYNLIKDDFGEEPGDYQAWTESLDAVINHADPADHGFFLALDAAFALESYIDWVLFQGWGGSADNGGDFNRVVYRPEGGRWHFMCYDQDAMFRSANRDHDFLRFYDSADQAEWEANRPPECYLGWSSCSRLFPFFHACLQNSSFRALMRQRWDAMWNSVLSTSWRDACLDGIVAAQQPAEAFHDERWDFLGSFTSITNNLRGYLDVRTPQVNDHVWARMDAHMDPVELERFTAVGDDLGQVTVAWQTYREVGNDGWRLERRDGALSPWQLVAEVAADGAPDQGATYGYADVVPAGGDVAYRLAYEAAATTVVIPWAEPVDWPDAPPAPVLINEFMASNDTVIQDETGAYEDWVELYNPGAQPVDLTGYHLSDDPAEPLKWPLPAGTMIPAGEMLLVWCDDDPEDGPLHAGFKLSAGGESIGIYALQDEAVVVVDEHTFGAQVTDVSEGRAPDGGTVWQAFDPASPGAPNTGVGVDLSGPLALAVGGHPNPFNPRCTVTYTLPSSGPVQVRVFDVQGRLVRRLVRGECLAGVHRVVWDGCDDHGARQASGIYQVMVSTGGEQQTCKLTLLK